MKKKREPQRDLFGDPIEPKARIKSGTMSISFDGKSVRYAFRGDDTWWVAADLCKVLGLGNTSVAVNGNPNQGQPGLDDDEKGLITHDTPGGPQDLLSVNESGLYALIFKSRKPEAKRFRKWVSRDVLPSIRKYGYYALSDDRVARERKRLKSDEPTARVRLKRKSENKGIRERLRAASVPVRTEVGIYNALHLGQTGFTAAGLRARLGLKPHHTPLDYMSGPCLSQGLHAQILAERICQDHNIPHADWPEIFEAVTRDLAERDLALMGPGSQLGIRDDRRRGPILDIVRPLSA